MPAADLPLLIDAARAAGELARPYWRADPQVWDKSGGQGPVTEADLAVDRALRETLLAARPDYGWLSEETADDETRLHRKRVFIVDPIDGTRAFVEGQESWAHSIAVAEQGRITAAVVHLPIRERLYAAARGEGATLDGTPIRVSRATDPDTALVLAARFNFDPQHWRTGVPGFARHFRPSLAYRLGLVAEGRFDAMLSLRDAWEWDIAAGSLIVSEAGGTVTDRHGAPIGFNSPLRRSSGVVASAPALHTALRARMA
ncbi:inositol monophosphatase family protein [Tranquillimonas rosea]|uniref:inositol monophosphatase family protein n=1 Tax=Tranquillimonas rosea TaxID=641238 RepID=UPI003BA92700